MLNTFSVMYAEKKRNSDSAAFTQCAFITSFSSLLIRKLKFPEFELPSGLSPLFLFWKITRYLSRSNYGWELLLFLPRCLCFFHLLIYSVLHISENFLGARRSVLVSNNYLNQVWLSETVALMLAPSLAKIGQKSFIWSYYWVNTKNWMGEIDYSYENICGNNPFLSYLTCLLLWSYVLNPKCLLFKYLKIKFPSLRVVHTLGTYSLQDSVSWRDMKCNK